MAEPAVVRLAAEDDVAGFRAAARRLLMQEVPPGDVSWHVANAAAGDLFASDEANGALDAVAAATDVAAPVRQGASPPIKVPAFFVPLVERAALHAEPGRFGLLYRLLWRLVHEPGLRDDPLDADRLEAERMARAVRRDMHKMTAFVRFRPLHLAALGRNEPGPGSGVSSVAGVDATGAAGAVAANGGEGERRLNDAVDVAGADRANEPQRDAAAGDVAIADPAHEAPPDDEADRAGDAVSEACADLAGDFAITVDIAADIDRSVDPAASADAGHAVRHVAWFEPEHHIVAATAPFFARRFAQLDWAILTPEQCVRWDGRALLFGPGANRAEAPPADAAERLWLTYYASIFNPARLKLAMMQKEMPRKYWKNLPEAVLIQPLTAAAAERSGRMVERPATEPARRRPAASSALRVGARPSASHPPGSLAALREATEHCRACPIGALATQAVNGAGAEHAALMLVGEQPGDQEDLRGQPFVGPAGQLLDRALKQLGWPREKLYLTNAVKHFKFELRGKRRIHKTPAQQEVAACLHWLENEIALVRPNAAVALGATAARALLRRAVPVTKERGQWLTRDDGLRVLVTLHPSALLRMEPADKEAAFAAWLDDLAKASREWQGALAHGV